MKLNRMTVYISGPITTGGNVYKNLNHGIVVWRELVKRKYAPFCPHMNDVGYLVTGEPVSWEEALEIDEEFVAMCDVLLRLPGKSKGGDREVAHAIKMGVPVVYSIDELDKHRNNVNLNNQGNFQEG